MSTTTERIPFDGRMSFSGGTDRAHMDSVHNFHNAVANTMFAEHLGKECAVAIRRWYLENNCLHPEDSAPMSEGWAGHPCWDDFAEQTDGQGGEIDRLARAEWAQRRICRALREAVDRSDVPLIDFIQAAIPDTWDDKDGIDYLLDLALWKPAKEVQGDD